MIDLTGKHILVAGGDISMMRGIIKRLQDGGATVIISHHHFDIIDKLYNEFGCDRLPINWHDLDEAAQDYLKQFETIDGAIICPFWHPVGKFIDSTPLEWDDAIAVNYEAAVYLSQAVAKHMIQNKVAGSIIFLTSVTTLMPFVDTSLYSTSLAMLHPLAKMAAVDCGQYGIRTNMIAMGWIKTESTQPYLNDEGRKFIETGIPLGEVGQSDAIGDACCFLLSDLSRYITGTVLTVDGGYILTRSEGDSPYPQKQ